MAKRPGKNYVWKVLLAGYLMVAGLGYVDYLTGDYSILIFYGIPVSFVTWFLGRKGIVYICVASGLARVVSDYYSYSASTLRYWNSFQDMLFLFLVGFLVAFVKKLTDKQIS